MAPAQTIHEAAHSGMLDPRLSPWSEEIDAGALYIERPGNSSGHPQGQQGTTQAKRMRTRLLSTKGDLKVLFTGQVGSGKSSELEQLWDDPELAARFERVRFVATEEPLDLHAADMRQLLVALSAVLARHIEDNEYHRSGRGELGPIVDKDLRNWIKLLQTTYEIKPPNPGDDPTVQFGAAFMKFSTKLRSEASLRAKLRDDDQFGVVELRGLTSDLLSLIRQAAERPVLVVFDDLDKLALDAAKDVFFAHMEDFRRLACSAVITYPYVLHYDQQANAAMLAEPFVLENVKTIRRAAPDEPLETAVAFFAELLGQRVVPALISDEAIALAVAHCAGIPREFLRIIQRAFLLTDEYGLDQVGAPEVEAAIRFIRRHQVRQTQSDQTRTGLMNIRRTHQLAGVEDWELIQALLAVEYTNDEPWYDVHPILADYIDRLIDEDDAKARGS